MEWGERDRMVMPALSTAPYRVVLEVTSTENVEPEYSTSPCSLVDQPKKRRPVLSELSSTASALATLNVYVSPLYPSFSMFAGMATLAPVIGTLALKFR